MHAITGAVLAAAAAILFGLAYYLFRKSIAGRRIDGEAVVTLVGLVWTTLVAFAIVELTKFASDWRAEAAEVGLPSALALGLLCLAAFALAFKLVRAARKTRTFAPATQNPDIEAVADRLAAAAAIAPVSIRHEGAMAVS
ncbi:hypothetical protein [Roseibium salinum]|uniref:Uncharacterized protein n=1 Tax=Roseibium salinum TaxID=1604349 RepID=A0ABT3R6P7_9HYPH|nr:hypothetical protein [Roseibium sp. DSM 29163]MCX2724959.1 hypothetical protein [Roseibium sp. DSM 29163]MDN3721112.1 hypothetical protein [Roseibium salinum]